MISKEKAVITKKPYEKPALRIIPIETDQVLGVGCKQAAADLAFGASPCPVNGCSEPGS